MIEHKGVVNTVLSLNNIYDFSKGNKVTAFTSYVFDVSVSEFFTALFRGGVLYLLNEEIRINPLLISKYIIDNEINYVYLPPVILATLPRIEYKTLFGIIYAGEPCDINIGKYWASNCKLYNYYGPTEITIYASGKQIIDGDTNLIGTPITNAKCYVLSANLTPLPIGVIGELHIGGVGVARGYLNKPELTAEKFIANPFQTTEEKKSGSNAKLYKTGDLVRWLADGNLEYIGRNDFQVKIRGFRIELGEIENALNSYEGIKQSVVLATENADDKYLLAYYVAINKLDEKQIFQYLQSKLPDYMIPRHFIFLDKLPLNINGKLDRKALLEYKAAVVGQSNIYAPPANAYEKELAEVWAKVLGRERVSIHDNFFDLGGHSLLLIKMVATLPQYLQEKLKLIDVFKYPTVNLLSKFLMNEESKLADTGVTKKIKTNSGTVKEVAIIGMAGRFPGAENIEEFWENLKSSKESITFYTKEELAAAGIDKTLLDDPNYVRAQGKLSDIKGFNANFFGYTDMEAQIMDPQHRLFITCALEALENAGYNPQEYKGNIGIYAGSGTPVYWMEHASATAATDDLASRFQLMLNNANDFLTTRVAYKFNLTGPAISVQTACSTSLVAVHQACGALQLGDCDIALAGGVSLTFLEKQGYLYQPGMIYSPDGKCRAFDAEAQGTVSGQGVGIVVLKPLQQAIADKDHIYAVIKASAINNDGHNKIGFTAPSSEQQAEVIRSAQEKAGIIADSVTYIETHGTATTLGDPIEIEGLSKAFKYITTDKKQYCAIGSVKTNVGHLGTAAGVTGLIKTALCLYHRTLVPSLHYNKANPKINFADSHFYVNTETKKWQPNALPLRAGVSSFGIGGTNAHVILEEAPIAADNLSADSTEFAIKPWQLISLSAHTSTALDKQSANIADFLCKQPFTHLEKMAYTLHVGRQRLKYNRFVVASSAEDIISALEQPDQAYIEQVGERPIVFMFPGQGAQYINMGKELYEADSNFKENIDKCLAIVKHKLYYNITLDDILGRTTKINQTFITQPALFIIEYALAQYLIHLGIKPTAMIGHSVGEYVTACLAGVFSLEDGIALIIERGRLLQSLPEGKMLAVPLSYKETAQYLPGYDLDIAVINDAESCVVAGSITAIDKFNDHLKNKGIDCQLLKVSHAFHSRMLKPILLKFYNAVSQIQLKPPTIPFISNLTGTWADTNKITTPQYWVDHLRNTVRFTQGLDCLFNTESIANSIFLEVGPSQILTSIARKHQKKQSNLVIPSMRRYHENKNDNELLLISLGSLYATGINIDWEKFYKGPNKCRISLPTYPFENKPYWIPAAMSNTIMLQHEQEQTEVTYNALSVKSSNIVETKILTPIESIIISIWQQILGNYNISIHDDFFDLGGNSLMIVQLASKLKKQLNVQIDLASIEKLTIHALAIVIEDKRIQDHGVAKHTHNPNVIMLKHGNQTKLLPLVLIHPIGGDVYFYRDLAMGLAAEQTVYAIRSPMLSGQAAYNSIEEMAEDYLQELKKFGIESPYILGGSSFGGIVAYQMAQILHHKALDTPTVILIDAPAYENMPKTMEDSAAILEYVSKYVLNNNKISAIKLRSVGDTNAQIQYAIEQSNGGGLDIDALTEINVNFLKVWQVNAKIMVQYVPSPYQGAIVFFSPTEVMLEIPTNQRLHWIKLAVGDFKSFHIPGNHITMNFKPNINIVNEHIRRIIEHETYRKLNKTLLLN
ncbi:unnamed protein product [Rotaria sp. Silwood2]|nr:unnamed protein product [Rotaria sp. Silwood2]